jgi:CBS domain-containing protein
MFSLYGVAGRLFRGSMEELRKVGPVSASARVSAMPGVAFDVGTPALSVVPAVTAHVHDIRRDALHAYAQTQTPDHTRHPLTRVHELMSRQVVTVPVDVSVIDAWHLLADRGIGQAPVVNADGMLVGMLTRADLLKPDRLPSPDTNALVWRAFLQQAVGDIMLTPVPSVAPDTDIRRVARVLLDAGLAGLPVVQDEGRVQGFISRSDILRAVVTDPPLDLWG